MTTSLDKSQIINLLPHREPMLLIDELINIKKLQSATAIMNVKKDAFYVQGHFPDQPVMPGVLIVEAFGQAAAALTAHGIDPKEYENKLVYFRKFFYQFHVLSMLLQLVQKPRLLKHQA